MPNIRSAAKNLRKSIKHRARNRRRKAGVKTQEKTFLACVEANDVSGAKEALKACFSTLDKAAKVGVIHPNKADRKKGRLTARLQKLTAAPAPADSEAPAAV